jgi:hypothetical protein
VSESELIANSIANFATGLGADGTASASHVLMGLPPTSGYSLRLERLATNPLIHLILSKYLEGWSCDQFTVTDRKNREHEKLTKKIRNYLENIREADRYSLIMGGAALIPDRDELIPIGSDELHAVDSLFNNYQYVGGLNGETQVFNRQDIIILDGKIQCPSRRKRIENRGWNYSYVAYLEEAVTRYEAAFLQLQEALRTSNMLGLGLEGFASLHNCSADQRRGMDTFFTDVRRAVDISNLFPYDKDLQQPAFMSKNLNGAADIFAKAVDNLVLHAQISYSGLMGMRAKSGLGSDEDETQSDNKTIDDHVERRIIPSIQRANELLAILPSGYTIHYDSLFSDDEKKAAEVEKINVDANAVRVNTVLQVAEATGMEPGKILQLLGFSQAEETGLGLENLVINSAQTKSQLTDNAANWLKGDEIYQMLMETELES